MNNFEETDPIHWTKAAYSMPKNTSAGFNGLMYSGTTERKTKGEIMDFITNQYLDSWHKVINGKEVEGYLMNTSNRSVTIEDESSTINSDIDVSIKNDVEASQKGAQTNFEANFGRRSVEMLKFLCHEMGVSEAGSKQDLVSRLVDESRKRNVSVGSDNIGKGKAVDVDSESREVPEQDSKSGFDSGKAFPNVFNNTSADGGDLGAKGSFDRTLPRMPFLTPDLFTNLDIQEGIWKKRELTKARNQWEYNEWCKAGLLLDKALFTGEVEYVQLARQVALERAYVVRVADEDGWNVVAKMASGDLLDPMSELFGGEREWARMAAQQFPKSKRSKVSYGQSKPNNHQGLPQFQAPGLFVPSFFQPQQPVNSNWQHNSPQGVSYKQQTSHESPGVSYVNSGTSTVVNFHLQDRVRPFVERVLDPKEADHTRVKTSQKVKDGSISDKTQLVTGRLHVESSVRYWKEVIRRAPIVVSWLEKRIPLFPRGVLKLATLSVPKQRQVTAEEENWIEQELERLRKSGADILLKQREEIIKIDLEGCSWIRAKEKGY
ncbi:42584_t:CDS:2 [Gigaspora margarita]|uniref:42584_t:CDS:1 n=1 Tax=Gigaspora margarita TaxID=4874 RepID=A0ABN7UKB9_GIGMA|nr:42584_t:CDS:2 [Gigaspora margarita]